MRITLFDYPLGEYIVGTSVRERLGKLGLDPSGVNRADVWEAVYIDATEDSVEWPTRYAFESVVEHVDHTGTHTVLYACPQCHELSDGRVCPHCGADITAEPEATLQTAEEIEESFRYNSPGVVVEFRCLDCGELFSVKSAVAHALATQHPVFHRV